jgi:hypothetical protein
MSKIMKYMLEMNEDEKTEFLNQIEENRKQHIDNLETALYNLRNNPIEFEESEIKKYNQKVKENNMKFCVCGKGYTRGMGKPKFRCGNKYCQIYGNKFPLNDNKI